MKKERYKFTIIAEKIKNVAVLFYYFLKVHRKLLL